jgi:hypothetical protein
MGAIAAYEEARATGVVIVANGYEQPPFMVHESDDGYCPSEEDEGAALCRDLEQTVFLPLIRALSVSNFQNIRNGNFPRFAKLSLALNEVLIGRQVSRTGSGFLDLIATIKQDDFLPWTQETRAEALFCVETLRRAQLLVSQFATIPVEPSRLDEDRDLAAKYTLSSLWAHLHIDCVVCAVVLGAKPSVEIMEELVRAMRTAVLAYSHARQGYGLRRTARLVIEEETPWDEEDAATVAAGNYFAQNLP